LHKNWWSTRLSGALPENLNVSLIGVLPARGGLTLDLGFKREKGIVVSLYPSGGPPHCQETMQAFAEQRRKSTGAK
jgi:hypothetical protein